MHCIEFYGVTGIPHRTRRWAGIVLALSLVHLLKYHPYLLPKAGRADAESVFASKRMSSPLNIFRESSKSSEA